MANVFELGVVWLADKLVSSAGLQVTYVRDGDETELVAVPGRTEFEQVDEYGIVHRIEARDFLIRTADLTLGGVATLPRAGDRIRAIIGGVAGEYEVLAPGNEPPWRYSDPLNQMLRIHTKQV